MQTSTLITRSIGVLAAIAAAAFTTGSASADGYQRRGVAPVAAGCANFGGFYVGGNIGWATVTAHQNDLDGITNGGEAATSFTATDDSFTGGVLVGYNIQKGCTLFGLEADWNWADLNANTHAFPSIFHPPLPIDDSLRTRVEGFGTIRTRTGVVVDQLLLYVTGGIAFADTKDSVGVPIGLITERFSSSDTRWGWVAGFGTEYKLAPNVSLTSDVLYLSFTDENHNFNCIECGGPFRTRTDDQIWVARMGVNFRFGGERDFVAAPLK